MVRGQRTELLGIRRHTRESRHMGLPCRGMARDESSRRARHRSRRRVARRPRSAAQGRKLLRARRRLCRKPAQPRTCLCLRSCRKRRKRRRRRNRHSSHMRLQRHSSGRALPPAPFQAFQRKTHPPRAGHSRSFRQRGEIQRQRERRRSRLPGRSRCGMRNGRRVLPPLPLHNFSEAHRPR